MQVIHLGGDLRNTREQGSGSGKGGGQNIVYSEGSYHCVSSLGALNLCYPCKWQGGGWGTFQQVLLATSRRLLVRGGHKMLILRHLHPGLGEFSGNKDADADS